MSILVDENTRVLVQGITGHQGSFHALAMKEFGTKVVSGTSPGKGNQTVNGVPVYNTVERAMRETRPNTSAIFVPAPLVLDAAIEAIDAGIKMIVIVSEHVPVHDAMKIISYAERMGVRIVGPNCPGIASPGKGKVAIIPNHIFSRGDIGVISRSGTLTYEIVDSLTRAGLGQSTCVGIGGDRVSGTSFVDCLEMFQNDKETRRIVLVGEIGGSAEEEAAKYISENVKKPVAAYIAGRSAPPGKRMGHAGAIISRGMGTAEGKIKALEEAGVAVASTTEEIVRLIGKKK